MRLDNRRQLRHRTHHMILAGRSCRGQRFGPGSLWPISAGFRASWSCCAAAGRSECGEGWFEVAEVEGVFAELGEHGSRDVAGGSSSTVGDRVPEELP